MILPARDVPHFVPARPLEAVTVDGTWNALTVPASWGMQVLGELPGRGAAFEDQVLGIVGWILPPGSADGWPAADPVAVYRPGDLLALPSLDGHGEEGSFIRWLNPPYALTAPRALRAGLERVIGPLDRATRGGPVVACSRCHTVTPHVLQDEHRRSASGPETVTYACVLCLNNGRSPRPRHLRLVRNAG